MCEVQEFDEAPLGAIHFKQLAAVAAATKAASEQAYKVRENARIEEIANLRSGAGEVELKTADILFPDVREPHQLKETLDAVKRFKRTLPDYLLFAIAEYAKERVGSSYRFKYFCKVCWAAIK